MRYAQVQGVRKLHVAHTGFNPIEVQAAWRSAWIKEAFQVYCGELDHRARYQNLHYDRNGRRWGELLRR